MVITTVSVAWFSKNIVGTGSYNISEKTADVNYNFSVNSTEFFVEVFSDDSNNYYNDDDFEVEDDTYIRTETVSVVPASVDKYFVYNGVNYVRASGDYNAATQYYIRNTTVTPTTYILFNSTTPQGKASYKTTAGETISFLATKNIENSTDRIEWSSGDISVATIGKYSGKAFTLGFAGESSTITVAAKDRNPVNPGADITCDFVIEIIAKTDNTVDYNFLPANVDIVRPLTALSLINTSTVDTKLRLRVEWEYSDYDDETVYSDRTEYDVETLFASYIGAPVTVVTTGDAPITMNFAKSSGTVIWNSADTNGILTFVDPDGIEWCVDDVSLNDVEYASLMSAISATVEGGTLGFTFIPITLDKAHALIYYGAETTATDYGSVVAPSTNVTLFNSVNTTTNPSDYAIKITEDYTSYSTRNVFSLRFIIQARQADYFVLNSSGDSDDGWFDVVTMVGP